MKHLEINQRTWTIAEDAIRDILYMYWDMSQSGAFAHNTETGRFNASLWIAVAPGSDGYGSEEDLSLLHRGSAVKLLCMLSDHAHEREEVPKVDSALEKQVRELLEAGAVDHLPSAKQALQLGMAGQFEKFWDQLEVVYEEYVVDTFRAAYG